MSILISYDYACDVGDTKSKKAPVSFLKLIPIHKSRNVDHTVHRDGPLTGSFPLPEEASILVEDTQVKQ